MKKFLSLVLCLTMAVSILAGCGSSQSASTDETSATAESGAAVASDAIVLTYAEVNPIDSLDGKVATFFKEKVEELTNGTVTIDIQASGVLGAEADILDGMVSDSGTVDIARISIFDMTNYNCNLSSLVALPFTFESRDHYWAFTETDLAQQLLDQPSELGLGLQGLFFMEEGFRDYFFKEDVESIDDMAGLKIRVSTDPILTQTTELLGASATVVAFTELYSSLQSGVVDGGDQPIALYESNAFNEVAPYLLKDEHTLSASETIMTESAMAKLSDDQLAALKEAGAQASAYCKEISAQEEEESETRLKENGVTIVEVADKTPWREKVQSVIDEYTEGLEDEYQTILDCAE